MYNNKKKHLIKINYSKKGINCAAKMSNINKESKKRRETKRGRNSIARRRWRTRVCFYKIFSFNQRFYIENLRTKRLENELKNAKEILERANKSKRASSMQEQDAARIRAQKNFLALSRAPNRSEHPFSLSRISVNQNPSLMQLPIS